MCPVFWCVVPPEGAAVFPLTCKLTGSDRIRTRAHMHARTRTQVTSPNTEPVCKSSAFVNLTVENVSRSLSPRLVLAF